MLGGRRIPITAGGSLFLLGPPAPVFERSTMSIRALATPIAGTTHLPQLHCMPAQANLPMLDPHAGLGQIRRPDNGAISVDE